MDTAEDAFEWSTATFALGARDSFDNGKFSALTGPPNTFNNGQNPFALDERGGFLVRCARCALGGVDAVIRHCADNCSSGSCFSVGAVLDYVPTDTRAASVMVYAKEEEWFTKPIYQKLRWSKTKSIGTAVVERKRKRQHAEHEHIKTAARTVVFEGIIPYNIAFLNAIVKNNLPSVLNVGQPLYANYFGMTLTEKPDPDAAFIGTYFGAIPESPGEIYILLASSALTNNFVGIASDNIKLSYYNSNKTLCSDGILLSIERFTENKNWAFVITYTNESNSLGNMVEYWAPTDTIDVYKTHDDPKKTIDDSETQIKYDVHLNEFKYDTTVPASTVSCANRIANLEKKDTTPFALPLF